MLRPLPDGDICGAHGAAGDATRKDGTCPGVEVREAEARGTAGGMGDRTAVRATLRGRERPPHQGLIGCKGVQHECVGKALPGACGRFCAGHAARTPGTTRTYPHGDRHSR
jgi:hypothetical protein